MTEKIKPLWSVSHGVDSRHLFECKSFKRKLDAQLFIDSLVAGRAWKLVRIGENENKTINEFLK